VSTTPIRDEAERAGGNMMDFAIHLEASDPTRNIWRAYSITAGQKPLCFQTKQKRAVMCDNALRNEKMLKNALGVKLHKGTKSCAVISL
jgi:hypothetical protein